MSTGASAASGPRYRDRSDAARAGDLDRDPSVVPAIGVNAALEWRQQHARAAPVRSLEAARAAARSATNCEKRAGGAT